MSDLMEFYQKCLQSPTVLPFLENCFNYSNIEIGNAFQLITMISILKTCVVKINHKFIDPNSSIDKLA